MPGVVVTLDGATARPCGTVAARRRPGGCARRRHLRVAAGARRQAVPAGGAPGAADAVGADDGPARAGPAALARGRRHRGVERWIADGGDEAVLRLVYSRGRESGSPPTGAAGSATSCTAFATIAQLPARVAGARRNGLAALTLARGLPADGAADMPWLLAGAKTLSYAVNMAALRHAERHGAGDVIFVSSDGYILEGPRSTVVIATELRRGRNSALLTPPPWYPILRGTTQQALFEVARNKGYDCDYRALRPADLVCRARGLAGVEHHARGAGAHAGRQAAAACAVGGRIRRTGRRRNRQRSLEIGCRCAGSASTVARTQGRRWSDQLIDLRTCEVAAS